MIMDIPHISPKHQVVYKGYEVEIMCFSFETPKWLKNSGRHVNSKYTKGVWFSVSKAKDEHSGIYVCEGYDINQMKFSASTELIVAGK